MKKERIGLSLAVLMMTFASAINTGAEETKLKGKSESTIEAISDKSAEEIATDNNSEWAFSLRPAQSESAEPFFSIGVNAKKRAGFSRDC